MSQESKVWMLFNTVTKKRSEALTKSEMQMALFSMKIKEIENIFIWTAGWANWQPLKEFLSSDQKQFIGYNPNHKIKSIDESSVPEFSFNSEVTQKAELEKFKDTYSGAGDTKTDIPLIKDIRSAKEVNINKKNQAASSAEPGRKNKSEIYKDKTFTRLVNNDEFTKDKSKEDFYRSDVHADELLDDHSEDQKVVKLKTDKEFVPRSERHIFKIEVIVFFPNGKSLKSYSRNISLTGTLIEDNIPYEQNGKTFEIVIVNRFESDPKKARMTMKARAVGEGVTRRLKFQELSEAQLNKLHDLLAAYIEKEKELKAA